MTGGRLRHRSPTGENIVVPLSDVLADTRALLPGVAFDTVHGTLFNPGRLAASLGISTTGDGSFDRWTRKRRRSWCKGV